MKADFILVSFASRLSVNVNGVNIVLNGRFKSPIEVNYSFFNFLLDKELIKADF